MLGTDTPVGVISIPRDDFDSARWWASSVGIRNNTKDFVGWFKEVFIGLRS
jgi:hypothetical protein